MKQILLLNPENVSEEEVETYPVREAARAIVLDSEGKVALLHVSKKNYYKLPGGGLEGNEDRQVALQRECKEEIGCEIEVLGEVGSIVEYRKIFSLKQISYCYFGNVKGEKGTPEFTGEEITDEFKEVWVSYDEALRLMRESKATDIEGSDYIVPRDIALLEAAKDLQKR